MHCPTCKEELATPGLCRSCNWEDAAQLAKGDSQEHKAKPEPSSEPEQLRDGESAGNGPETSEKPERAKETDETARADETAPAEPNSQPSTSSGATNLKETTLTSQGDIIIIGQANGLLRLDELGQKADYERNLYEVTTTLPQREIKLSHSLLGQLDANLMRLRANRLILVSCYNQRYALDAAHAVVERLDISHQEQKRLLYFEGPAWENSEISIHALMQKRIDSPEESAIIVDALEDSAQAFCESLFGNDLKASVIKEDLRRKKVFLLCVVDSTYIERRLEEGSRELNFPVWRIPFLLPLLEQHHYMELAEEIRRQREEGRWSKDESEFFFEITSYINSKQLADLVKKGGKPIEPEPVDSVVEEAGPIGKTVLYVATYFPNTTPTEFCRIVESLLSERTATVTTQSYILSDNGSKQLLQAERQVPLARAWDESKDAIFKKWLREMISPRDSTRVIGFSNPALREALKEHFEKEHRFYLLDQFNAIQKQGVLFYHSPRIAESTTRLTLDRMLNYPDEYDTTWLVNTIIDLKQKIDAETIGSDNPMNQLRKISQRSSSRWAYSRISELMSRMLEHAQLRSEVDNCLDYLIKTTLHDWTLNIVKQLRFVPEFDDLYWIKQLLDRADEKTRNQAYDYLLSYLKKMDANIYGILSRLATWMPEEDRDPYTYSRSSRIALRLLIQYFLETTARFDRKYYGAWPSQYPLFAFTNKVAATAGLALLTKWLFHPGLKLTLENMKLDANPYHLIAALLAEWTFILLGPNTNFRSSSPPERTQASNSVSSDAGESEASEGDPDPLILLDLLLQQISLRVNIFQRSELLSYWDKVEKDLLKLITSYLRPNDQQKELTWKRDRVKELTRRFKGLTSRPKAS